MEGIEIMGDSFFKKIRALGNCKDLEYKCSSPSYKIDKIE
jgi:hypothetical protein